MAAKRLNTGGLLSQASAGPGTAALPGAMNAMAGGEAGAEESNVSPEEQAQYEQFVSNGMQLLYDKKAVPQIIESIRGGGNPVEGLANTLAMVVMRLEDSAGKAGQKLSQDAVFHGAVNELMPLLVEMAETAGVHEFKPEEVESALYQALDTYRSTRQSQGQLPQEAFAADMEGLMQAEQSGQLEDVLPGITEYAKKAPQPGQAQQGRARV